MRPRRLVFALLAAILVPCGVLAALGIRTLATDAARAEARYRERAEAAVDAAANAFAAALAGLADPGSGALPFVARPDGLLLEPAPPTRAADPFAGDLAALESYEPVAAEADRLEREGDLDRAASKLRAFATAHDDTGAAAAALTAEGAIERKAGQADAARRAYREIAERYRGARDGRGLRRDLAARWALVELAPEARDFALYADLVEDESGPDDVATALLKRRVRARLADDPGVAAIDERDRRKELERRLFGAWRAGGALFVAGGAPGGAAVVDGVAIAVRKEGDLLRGGALDMAALARAALARPEIAAFAALGFLVRESDGAGEPLARRRLAAPLGSLELAAFGTDVEGFRRAERRRLATSVALAAAALLTAALAAAATVRAVSREVAAARARESFVAAVTHELKAPLASIRLIAELLAAGGVEEPKARDLATHVVKESDRLSRLVAQVLDLARIEHGGRALARRAPIAPRALAEEAALTFAPLARDRGFSVALRPGPALPAVLGDRDALLGALLNLLDNALKYAERPHEIELEATGPAGGRVTLAVLDRGRGVAPTDAARIFEPFARGGDEMTRDRPGVGLGLALVREVALAHGGRATYEPREGGGSRFALELPIRTAGAGEAGA